MVEEAIEILENRAWWDMVSILTPRDSAASAALHSAVDMGISALRAQQAKLDRSRWGECEMCGDGEVNASPGAHDFVIADDCLFYNDSSYGLEGIRIKYCPACGRPLTEEAWAELERRINGG